MTSYQRGYLRGQMDRGTTKLEPKSPYKEGTENDKRWLEGYKAGRYPAKLGPSETKDATVANL